MMRKKYLRQLVVILFFFISFPLLAQNQPVPQQLIEKIVSIQEILQSGDDQAFFSELEYPEYVENRYFDYSVDGRNEFIASDETRIKKIFTHLVFDQESNSFPKVCFEVIDREHSERTEECLLTFWSDKKFSIFNLGKSFDFSDKNGEIFEFSSTTIFEFDFQKNRLKIIEIHVAG